jgi:hypothetical protein
MITSKGRTWAACSTAVLLASAASVGLLVPALSGPLTLEQEMAAVVAAANAGDPEPSMAADADCRGYSREEVAAGREKIQGWTFELASVEHAPSRDADWATVTINAFGPQGQRDHSTTSWVMQRGAWLMLTDGAC